MSIQTYRIVGLTVCAVLVVVLFFMYLNEGGQGEAPATPARTTLPAPASTTRVTTTLPAPTAAPTTTTLATTKASDDDGIVTDDERLGLYPATSTEELGQVGLLVCAAVERVPDRAALVDVVAARLRRDRPSLTLDAVAALTEDVALITCRTAYQALPPSPQ